MAKIVVKNSVTSGSAPAGLSLGEIAVNITDKKIFFGNAVESAVAVYDRNAHVLSFNGSTGAVTFVNYVSSLNGATGAITNVARTNQGNTFSVLQVMSAGITSANLYVTNGATFNIIEATSTTNTVDVVGTGDGAGLRIAQATTGSSARVGGIRLGRSTTHGSNVYLEGYVGTFRVYNGLSGTVASAGTKMLELSPSGGAIFGIPIAGATFTSADGRITVQKSSYIGSDSGVVRIVGANGTPTQYNSDIRANASAAADTTHTLPAVTGTLLNTASSYVVSVNGSTGAVTIATGLSWSAVTADRSLVAEEGVLANKSSGTLTLTLPTTAALGKVIRVSGMQNTWRIAQNASQKINFGKTSTTVGTGGYLESSNARDAVELVCCVANTEWNVISSIGNITIV